MSSSPRTRVSSRTPSLLLTFGLVLGCGNDTPSGDDEVGESETGTEDATSETSESSEDTSSTDETTSETTDETTSETTDDSSETTDSTETGDGDQPFEVGVDVRSIDPVGDELNGLYLGGFGAPFTRGTATGVHDSLYARSFAIGSGDEVVVFTIVDAVGMGNQWTREIRQQAALATGISAERLIVASTHSHSGPDFQGLWGGVSQAYRDKVIATVVASMQAAADGREPADLSVSSPTALNNNRRGWGFTDDSMLVLQAHAQDDQALLGTMIAFAAHPVVLGADNKELSRDYVGYAVDALEASTSAPVVWFNGILGDVSPNVPDGQYADDFERAEAYGIYLADQAIMMIDVAEPVDLGIATDYESWEMQVSNVLFNLAGQLGILDYDFEAMGLSNFVTTQTAYVRLGTTVQILAFPGESLTRNGLPIKEVMQAPYKAVLGNAGDALGYFVPSDEWNTGLNDNYEEGVSLGMSAGDTAQAVMIEMIEADVF